MKKIKYYLAIGILSAVVYACDKIEGNRIETNNSGQQIGDNAIVISGDTLTVVDDALPTVQNVMIEEFTGHLCGTCPPAGGMLNDTLRNLFGDRLVAIGIHSGQFAEVCPTSIDCPSAAPAGSFTADFRCGVSDALTTKFGVTANPLGMVNRVGYPTSHKKTYLSWKSAAQAELAIAPSIRMKSTTLYNSSTREVKAAVTTEMLAAYSGSLKVQMVIVEDSIVDWQQWYNHTPQLVPDYVFHDVLRASMNGDFGGDLTSATTINVGTKFINGYFSTLSPNWVAEKCKVVSYIYDANTYKVIQAIETKVVQ